MEMLPIETVAACLGSHVDIRVTVQELDVIAEDADGMAETWGDYARDEVDPEEKARYTQKAALWEAIAQRTYAIRLDLDKRAREQGCA